MSRRTLATLEFTDNTKFNLVVTKSKEDENKTLKDSLAREYEIVCERRITEFGITEEVVIHKCTNHVYARLAFSAIEKAVGYTTFDNELAVPGLVSKTEH